MKTDDFKISIDRSPNAEALWELARAMGNFIGGEKSASPETIRIWQKILEDYMIENPRF